VLAVLALIIVVGKSLIAFGIIMLLRFPIGTRSRWLTISASLAQIGEFSFILDCARRLAGASYLAKAGT
jgi:CPA2 family monovalent cation:H+ antiporter-2